jgi:hypothetical protein
VGTGNGERGMGNGERGMGRLVVIRLSVKTNVRFAAML